MNSTAIERSWSSRDEAVEFLIDRGFDYTNSWCWLRPAPGYRLDPEEESAVAYLMEEHEFGQVLR